MVPNQIIYRLTQSPLSTQSQPLFPSNIQITAIETIGPPSTALRHQSMAPESYLVSYKGDALPLDVAKKMSQNPQVLYAQPNYIYSVQLTPNDLYYSIQKDQLESMQFPAAWDYTTGSNSIVLCIIDTGILTEHEDLKNQLWTNPSEIAGNAIDDDGNGLIDDIYGWNYISNTANVLDDFGHGSMVSGIAASQTNNTKGVAGACPDCKIMTLKAGNAAGIFTTGSISKSLQYAIQKKANIINMSLGGSIEGNSDSELNTRITDALAQNISIVGAAGNNGKDIINSNHWPATQSNIIVVSAVDNANPPDLATYSNFGDTVWITAPGSSITGPSFIQANSSSSPNESYTEQTGTSMSTPFITGAIGLLLSIDPKLTPDEIKEILKTSSKDLGSAGKDTQFGYGLLQVNNALQLVDSDPPTGSVTHLLSHPSNQPLIITSNITDTPTPTVILYYQELNQTTPLHDWLSTPMTYEEPLFSATLPTPNPEASHIQYYAQASDYTNKVNIPSSLTPHKTTLIDLSGPAIRFVAQTDDYFDTRSALTLTLKDQTSVSLNSLEFNLNTTPFTYSNTPSLFDWQAPTLNIDLSGESISESLHILTMTASDSLGNSSTETIELLYTETEQTQNTTSSIKKPINVPNPFDPHTQTTAFASQVTQPCTATIAIYDLYLTRVHTINTSLNTGYNEISWNGRNSNQEILADGVYIYVITHHFSSHNETFTQKLVIQSK